MEILPEIVPRTRSIFNVSTSMGFTEIFDERQVDILCQLGLIKYDRSIVSLGVTTHFYMKGN